MIALHFLATEFIDIQCGSEYSGVPLSAASQSATV